MSRVRKSFVPDAEQEGHGFQRQSVVKNSLIDILIKLAKINGFNADKEIRGNDGNYMRGTDVGLLTAYVLQSERFVNGKKEFVDLLLQAGVSPTLITNENMKIYLPGNATLASQSLQPSAPSAPPPPKPMPQSHETQLKTVDQTIPSVESVEPEPEPLPSKSPLPPPPPLSGPFPRATRARKTTRLGDAAPSTHYQTLAETNSAISKKRKLPFVSESDLPQPKRAKITHTRRGVKRKYAAIEDSGST